MEQAESAKRRKLERVQALAMSNDMQDQQRLVHKVGFLGISDYGFGQLEILADRYCVTFVTSKAKLSKHAEHLQVRLMSFCRTRGIEYLGSIDANSSEVVERAQKTDLVVVGGYDKILRSPILEAPRHGVLNTHLGVLPLNRGCNPTMWAQLHGLPQGYTTYSVGTAIDHGAILDRYIADSNLGGLLDNNRQVYDALATKAVERFEASLDRFEAGVELSPCEGDEAYHRRGMPNDSWLSFTWSNKFLRRFSLAMHFHPYLPGCGCLESADEPVFLTVEGDADVSRLPQDWEGRSVGEVIAREGLSGQAGAKCTVIVRTRESAVRCLVHKGPRPCTGDCFKCPSPADQAHVIANDFDGDVLPIRLYRHSGGGPPPQQC